MSYSEVIKEGLSGFNWYIQWRLKRRYVTQRRNKEVIAVLERRIADREKRNAKK